MYMLFFSVPIFSLNAAYGVFFITGNESEKDFTFCLL
ncbi:hypothetical protein HNR45_000398 [Negativicoccus succinicivorans]|uniref:Uncharacterized protein n=1 Tax=Negativicoccus succinicivorans TaxID=620903 RepID=A0A841R3F6_9FIRM|nr:hypothetical protein [Negativicoccus succinicivorans]